MTMNLIEPTIPEYKVTSVWQRSSRYIVCLFCELRARQVGDSPFCSNCLIDPVQTRIAIHMQMDDLLIQQVKAFDVWETLRETYAAHWDKIQAARDQPDFGSRCAAHRDAGNVYGQLLDAHAAYEAALQPLNIERARLEKALEVIDTL